MLFILAPVVMRVAVYDYNVPLFYALPPVLVLMMVLLFADPTLPAAARTVAGVSRCATLVFDPDPVRDRRRPWCVYWHGAGDAGAAVSLASERPGKWLKIMSLYPFTSVLAQEFVYRVFFFHRYGPLFSNRWLLIGANALAFGFGHILFRNWIAVVATVIGGALFAWRYERTRSFWAVWAEHTLWGWMVFTVGLGVYLFHGRQKPVVVILNASMGGAE